MRTLARVAALFFVFVVEVVYGIEPALPRQFSLAVFAAKGCAPTLVDSVDIFHPPHHKNAEAADNLCGQSASRAVEPDPSSSAPLFTLCPLSIGALSPM